MSEENNTKWKKTLSNAQFRWAEFKNDYDLIYHSIKATVALLIALFFFSGIINLSDFDRFTSKTKNGFQMASWYEFFNAIICFIESGKSELSIFFNSHQRLSHFMGSMATYKGLSFSLTLCYFILYLRSLSYHSSRILKGYPELSKSLYNFSQTKSLNSFLANLEIAALFEFMFWKVIHPFSAENTYLMLRYYFLIIAFCYVNDPVHNKIWKRIYTVILNTASKSSHKKELKPFIEEIGKRFWNITNFVASLSYVI